MRKSPLTCYRVVSTTEPGHMVYLLNSAADAGWEPVGGISTAFDKKGSSHFTQLMSKRVQDPCS